MSADLETLRKRWNDLFDEVIQHGRSLGQKEALTSLMQSVQTQLQTMPGDDTRLFVPEQQASEDDTEEPAKRARPGFVQEQTDLILRAADTSLTPMRIAEIARGRGIDLKEGSVRMALHGLQGKGRAIPLGNGEWSPIVQTPIARALRPPNVETATFEQSESGGEPVPEFIR